MPYVGGVRKLVSVVQDLSSARSLERIMALVRTAAREIAHSDGATFVLREGNFCHYADENAISPLWKGQRFPIDSCISGWAMLNKKAVAIYDISKDPRIPIEAYRPTFVRSLAMVPIRRDRPVGAIGVYWAKTHHTSAEELELLQALADTVSVAMENVNLYSALSSKVEALQEANEAKDNFLLTVSHELRTPLNAITGWVDILKEDPALEEEQRVHALDVIDRNARAQTRIIDDLIDSTRIVLGRLRLEQQEVDLVEVAKEAIASVQFEAKKKGISLHLLIQISKAPILGDAVRMRQVMCNLLVNAIKFSHDQGQVFLKIQGRGPGVEVLVQDQGVGIAPKDRDLLFQRFHQADSTTTRKHGGLGLGLSICKHLVENHGGHINVFSQGENMGTTVTFSVPMIDKNKETVAAALEDQVRESAKSDKRLRGLHILAVDDDEDSLGLMEVVLRRSGARVEKANSVGEAIRLSRLHHFDALVSDLSMPEEDGFSLMRKVRSGQTAFPREIPAVAVTAFNDKENEIKALAAGFDQFFGKPFSGSKLIHTLETYGVFRDMRDADHP
ncbi:ATP-binding protein [Bdellovibrio sp. HCB2-146]|uniref:hybrid sensor histidine kinase/response regulator n=1 Tax=Bdellovibrio sp. HCB2-146 TaxID=3394362 RepID=UPI0039BC6CB5